jgi:hypothetical protein
MQESKFDEKGSSNKKRVKLTLIDAESANATMHPPLWSTGGSFHLLSPWPPSVGRFALLPRGHQHRGRAEGQMPEPAPRERSIWGRRARGHAGSKTSGAGCSSDTRTVGGSGGVAMAVPMVGPQPTNGGRRVHGGREKRREIEGDCAGDGGGWRGSRRACGHGDGRRGGRRAEGRPAGN